jgi:hypothetical protein
MTEAAPAARKQDLFKGAPVDRGYPGLLHNQTLAECLSTATQVGLTQLSALNR